MSTAMTTRFRELHSGGFFVMPNPWDVGSAIRLQRLGVAAVATTSSGHAWSLGLEDQQLSFEQVLAHVSSLAAALDVPVNVDAERLYGEGLAEVTEHAAALSAAGAAGLSIEDYDPAQDAIDEIDVAVERVGAAVAGARPHGVVVTARAEQHLYGVDDLDDTINRLRAFAAAGADVVYAPGLNVERRDPARGQRGRPPGERPAPSRWADPRRARRARRAPGEHRWCARPDGLRRDGGGGGRASRLTSPHQSSHPTPAGRGGRASIGRAVADGP